MNTASKDFCVWWLDSLSIKMIRAMNPDLVKAWPQYIQDELLSLEGRSGRGRLWVAEELQFDDHVRWDYGGEKGRLMEKSYGGIVLRSDDRWHVAEWPGFITDLYLQPIRGVEERLATFASEIAPLNTAAKLQLASQKPWQLVVNEQKQGGQP